MDKKLGYQEAEELLSATLEEKRTDELLTQIGEALPAAQGGEEDISPQSKGTAASKVKAKACSLA